LVKEQMSLQMVQKNILLENHKLSLIESSVAKNNNESNLTTITEQLKNYKITESNINTNIEFLNEEI